MFLADYCVHSSCSSEGRATMAEMAKSAAEKGITHMCFTDRCDFDSPCSIRLGPDYYSLPREQGHRFVEAQEKAPEGLDMRLGLDISNGNHDTDRALRIFTMPEYDFVLAGLRSLRGEEDFRSLKFTSPEMCHEFYDRYLEELIEYAAAPVFDVMTDIGSCYISMYKQGQDVELTADCHRDRIDELLRALKENGRGIGVNCRYLFPGRGSAFRSPVIFPSVSVIRRYREIGGEVITVGSGSFRVQESGRGVKEAFDLLREIGFSYVPIYRHHKPEFIRI